MQRFARDLTPGTHAADSWKASPPTPHDLRRTTATRLASLGVPGEDVAAVLAHVTPGVTRAHYDRFDRIPQKRVALTRWSAALERILGGEPAEGEQVVRMRG
jgi:integrase